MEIRDKSSTTKTNRGKHVVRRLCQTLTNSVDVAKSEIQLLKDFICIKLYKMDHDDHWGAFGYDIANFTIPKTSQINSNYLKSAEPEKPEEPEEEVKEEDAEKTPEDLEMERRERVDNAMHRARNSAVSFIPLSCETIYGIH